MESTLATNPKHVFILTHLNDINPDAFVSEALRYEAYNLNQKYFNPKFDYVTAIKEGFVCHKYAINEPIGYLRCVHCGKLIYNPLSTKHKCISMDQKLNVDLYFENLNNFMVDSVRELQGFKLGEEALYEKIIKRKYSTRYVAAMRELSFILGNTVPFHKLNRKSIDNLTNELQHFSDHGCFSKNVLTALDDTVKSDTWPRMVKDYVDSLLTNFSPIIV